MFFLLPAVGQQYSSSSGATQSFSTCSGELMIITLFAWRVSIMTIMITYLLLVMNLVHGQQQHETCPPRNHGDAIKLVEPSPVQVSAVIESCMGWQLNKLPALKEFLLEGEAEAYQHVQMKYAMGRKPTMTIFHNERIHEIVQLEFYHSKAALHSLFQRKGVLPKSDRQQE